MSTPQYGLTKEEWRTVAEHIKPDLTEPEYEAMWDEFVASKEEAERLKAQGVKIHPAYGHKL